MKSEWKTEFQEAVGDLLSLPELQALRHFRHHRNSDRYTHSMAVAACAFRAAKRLGLDARSAARGALLHDFYYCGVQSRPAGDRGWVLLRHPEEALQNARRLTHLSPKEENIILSHMWPLSRFAPKSPEAVLVNLADTWVALQEGLRKTAGRQGNRGASRKAP